MNRAPRSIRTRRPRAILLAALALTLACVFIPQASATYPGHNGLITFSAQPDGHGFFQVYTIRPNGHDLRQVTHFDADSGIPDWSPDGRRIAFTTQFTDGIFPGSHCGVSTMNADGSGLVDLTGNVSRNVCELTPSFTPDGNRIFFTRCVDNGVEDICTLWNMDVNGGHRKPVQDQQGIFPTVSPDGSKLAIFEYTDPGPSLLEANLDGSGLHELLPPTFDTAEKYDWVPDGRHLVVGGNAHHLNPDDSANIATIRPDGSGLHYLTHYHDPAVNAITGTYSPDGRYIIFYLDDHGDISLMEMRSDGSHVKQIRDFGSSGFTPTFLDWGTSK